MKPGATLVALAVGLALTLEAPGQTAYEAELLGSSTSGPGQTDGTVTATLVVDGTSVTVTVSREDEIDPAAPVALGFQRSIGPLAVHVHEGGAGAAGRIVVELPWTSSWGGPSVTTTTPAPEGFAERLASNPQGFYVDIHTPSQPAGAARGQLRVSAPRPRRVEPYPVPRAGAISGGRQHLGSPGPAGARPPGPGAGGPPAPGFGTAGRSFRRGFRSEPAPPPPPSRATWEFFFRNATPADERSAGLLEAELPVFRQVALECVPALDRLAESPQPDERDRLLDEHVAKLRSLLGEAAFLSLASWVQGTYEAGAEGDDSASARARGERAAQELSFPPLPSVTYLDRPFRLVAEASSGLRVYFTASGDCSVRGSTVRILSAGNCWLTAHQPGNAEFAPAPQVVQRLRIDKAEQRIRGPEIGPRTYLEPDFGLSTSATSGLPVVFLASGKCTVHRGLVHLLGAGSCHVSAHQPGSANYLAAPIVDQEFEIARADQTISAPVFDDPPYGPDDLRFEPRASSALPVSVSTEGMCTFTGSSLRILGSGSCVVKVEQAGNADFNPAPSLSQAFEVVGEPPLY